MNLAEALRAEDLEVNEIPGWQTRGRPGGLKAIGLIAHHTAGTKSLNIIINGRPDLSGPLANLHLEKSGRVNLVAAGRCNHAGKGSVEVLDRLRRQLPPRGDAGALGLVDSADGNGVLFGVEVENLGDGSDPYPPAQIEALVKIGAALCAFGGFAPHACIFHREWTRRKPDMSWRGPLRELVAARLISQGNPAVLEWDWEEDDVKTMFMTISPLDVGGCGWLAWNPGFARPPVMVGLAKHGPFPPTDTYRKGSWGEQEPVDLSAQIRGNEVIVTARGGKPGGAVNVFVAVA